MVHNCPATVFFDQALCINGERHRDKNKACPTDKAVRQDFYEFVAALLNGLALLALHPYEGD